jgi:hypothetical protein
VETFLGLVMMVFWCGAGFLGASIRNAKGYATGTVGSIVWGGPLYLLIALVLPVRH